MDTDLPMAAGRLLFRLQAEMFERIAAEGFGGVRPRHGAVLAYLTPEGRRLSEYARLSGRHKQIIGTIADELVQLGYVTREPDPSDGRARLLVPTDLGLRELAAARAIIADIETRIAAQIGPDRLADAKSAMLAAADAI